MHTSNGILHCLKKPIVKIMYVVSGVDEKESSKILERYAARIESHCVTVTVVSNLFLALECLEHSEYIGVIVSDELSCMNAENLASLFFSLGIQIPIILLTSRNNSSITSHSALQDIYQGVLVQPYNADDLCRVIVSMLAYVPRAQIQTNANFNLQQMHHRMMPPPQQVDPFFMNGQSQYPVPPQRSGHSTSYSSNNVNSSHSRSHSDTMSSQSTYRKASPPPSQLQQVNTSEYVDDTDSTLSMETVLENYMNQFMTKERYAHMAKAIVEDNSYDTLPSLSHGGSGMHFNDLLSRSYSTIGGASQQQQQNQRSAVNTARSSHNGSGKSTNSMKSSESLSSAITNNSKKRSAEPQSTSSVYTPPVLPPPPPSSSRANSHDVLTFTGNSGVFSSPKTKPTTPSVPSTGGVTSVMIDTMPQFGNTSTNSNNNAASQNMHTKMLLSSSQKGQLTDGVVSTESPYSLDDEATLL